MKTPLIIRIFENNQLVEVKQFEQDSIIIGSGDEVGIRLSSPGVSPIHCLIEIRGSGYYLSDLGSDGGTKKNGKSVLDEPLSSGDQIEIGSYRLHFFVGIPKTVSSTPVMPQPAEEKPLAQKAPPSIVGPAKVLSSSPSSKKQSKRQRKTFAPGSEIRDLFSYLKPTKGPVLEILVAWKERVLSCQHFAGQRTITLGSLEGSSVRVPAQYVPTQIGFVSLSDRAQVFVPDYMNMSLSGKAGTRSHEELLKSDRVQRLASGVSLRLESGDLLQLTLGNGQISLFLRFVPKPPVAVLSGTEFTAGELTGLIVSVVLVSLFAIYMAVYNPTPEEETPEESLRLAQVVFSQRQAIEKFGQTASMGTSQQAPRVNPQTEPQPSAAKGDTASADGKKAARAQEVRPKPGGNRPKKFTSTKSGGAIKMSEKPSANAKSVDVNSAGILGAFSGSGTRKQLDKAYSGSGELLGMADQATGSSGQNENRAGDDLGSRFRDTGAGGKGTSTQGISGIGTKGRSSGQSEYGEVGVGGKGQVAIDVGGEGEGFSGGLDREGIRQVIMRIRPQLKACYERELRSKSGLEGKIIIQFEIVEKGRVRSAKVKSSSMGNADVENCVARRIKEQRYPEPPPGLVGIVDYPFLFGKQK